MRHSDPHPTRTVATPVGRMQLAHRLFASAWPLTSAAARLYRATVTRGTRVVAVVGSFGKTTTSRCTWAALGGPGREPRGRNARSFVARELLRIRPRERWAVLEVGISEPGWMARYARMLRPDAVVVTSVGSEHNRSFGTLEVTRAEKSEMVRALSSAGVAILNGDDPNVRWMSGVAPARVVTYGFEPGNDIVASGYRLDWPYGSVLEVTAGRERCEARLRLVGRHSVYAALAAVAVAMEAGGRALAEVVGAVADVAPTPGRMQPARIAGDVWLLRDENKSAPETIHAALRTLAEIPARRRIVVLGDVSEPDRPQHQLYREIGGLVATVCDQALLISSSPKNFRAYRAGGRAAVGAGFDPVAGSNDPADAVDWLRANLMPGDVVLVKGRDTQRMERISLALEGRQVRCRVTFCATKAVRCADCPMLDRG